MPGKIESRKVEYFVPLHKMHPGLGVVFVMHTMLIALLITPAVLQAKDKSLLIWGRYHLSLFSYDHFIST